MPIVSGLMPKASSGSSTSRTSPADSLQLGVHSSLAASSKHKRMVSGVLHLKKQSAGARAHPTAFKTGIKAFTPKTSI